MSALIIYLTKMFFFTQITKHGKRTTYKAIDFSIFECGCVRDPKSLNLVQNFVFSFSPQCSLPIMRPLITRRTIPIQQHTNQPRMAPLRRQHQRRLSLIISLIHPRTTLQQRLTHIHMPFKRGVMQRCPARVVSVLFVETAIQQLFDDVNTALGRCYREHGSALTVHGVDTAAPEEEEGDDGGMTHAGGGPQGTATTVVAVVDVGLVLQEEFADVSKGKLEKAIKSCFSKMRVKKSLFCSKTAVFLA